MVQSPWSMGSRFGIKITNLKNLLAIHKYHKPKKNTHPRQFDMAIINIIYRQIIMCIIYDGPFSVAKCKITRRYLSPSSPSPDCVPISHLPGPSFCRPPRCFPQGPKSTPEPWLEGSQANKCINIYIYNYIYIYIYIITFVIPYVDLYAVTDYISMIII